MNAQELLLHTAIYVAFGFISFCFWNAAERQWLDGNNGKSLVRLIPAIFFFVLFLWVLLLSIAGSFNPR